jgi:hypothetical protein
MQIDVVVNKIEGQVKDLDDLMPNPHTRHQYIKTIIVLHDQYLHEEKLKYDRKEKVNIS